MLQNKKFLWAFSIIFMFFGALFWNLGIISFSFLVPSSNDPSFFQIFMNWELWQKTLLTIGLYLFYTLFNYGYIRFKNLLLKKLLIDYKTKIYHSISVNAYDNIKTKQAAELQNAFLKDAELIREKRYDLIFNVINGLMIVLMGAIGIVVMNAWLLLVVVFLAVTMFFVSQYFQKRMVVLQNDTSKNTQDYGRGLVALFKGIPTLFAYNKMKQYHKKNEQLNDQFEKENLRIQNKMMVAQMGITGASIFATVLIFAAGGILVAYDLVGIGVLLAIGMIGSNFITSSEKVITDLVSLNSTKDIIKKYDVDHDLQTIKHTFKEVKTLSFNNVQVSYGSRVIINDFNYIFNQNKNYLIQGPSGTGKSTLVKTLVGLNPISSGDIVVNETKINDDNLIELRDKIAYIDQNIYLFDDSLAYNIALSKDYDEVRIKEILHEVKLDSFLDRSLKENIGGDLEKISGGEKRRIGLARAMYANREIFIVDETTSNLDPANKDAIEKLILEQNEKLILLISHDLSQANEKLIDEVVSL